MNGNYTIIFSTGTDLYRTLYESCPLTPRCFVHPPGSPAGSLPWCTAQPGTFRPTHLLIPTPVPSTCAYCTIPLLPTANLPKTQPLLCVMPLCGLPRPKPPGTPNSLRLASAAEGPTLGPLHRHGPTAAPSPYPRPPRRPLPSPPASRRPKSTSHVDDHDYPGPHHPKHRYGPLADGPVLPHQHPAEHPAPSAPASAAPAAGESPDRPAPHHHHSPHPPAHPHPHPMHDPDPELLVPAPPPPRDLSPELLPYLLHTAGAEAVEANAGGGPVGVRAMSTTSAGGWEGGTGQMWQQGEGRAGHVVNTNPSIVCTTAVRPSYNPAAHAGACPAHRL